MANAAQYANDIITLASQVVSMMARIEETIQRSQDDPTLLAEAFESIKNSRSDLAEEDFTAFVDAIEQILFPYNSGGPPPLRQKIYKML